MQESNKKIKTAEPIGPNFFYGPSKLKMFHRKILKFFYFENAPILIKKNLRKFGD